MKIRLTLLFLTVLFIRSSFGQTRIPFEVRKITDHIWIAHPPKLNRVSNTSTIILSPDHITVVESQTDEFMAGELIRAIRSKISGLPIKYLINTHFHLDHVLGTHAFLKENPGIIIIAHEFTAGIMQQRTRTEKDQFAAAMMQKAIDTRKLASVEANKEKRPELIKAAGEIEKYSHDLATSTVVFPNLTFRDSLTIWDGRLHIQLIFLGGGHTPGDIVLLIPEEKFLITGDLVHDYEPLFWDADIDNWLKVLKKVKALDFDYFAGGHGSAHKGKEIIDLWGNTLRK